MLPCPFLPQPSRVFTHEDIHALGADRGTAFYDTAMNYAQSLWLAGFPAKALLQINRGLACNLSEISLNAEAKPYHAVAWILQNRPADRFIGNPRRHYQHLATRMVEPHKELRIWRAWACWYLSKQILPDDEFPHDAKQVREELIVKPRRAEIAAQLARLSPNDDLSAWESALNECGTMPHHDAAVSIERIGVDQVGKVRDLAHRIWPAVYPGMISEDQITYMLKEMYDPAVLRDDVVTRGVHYALITLGSEDIGYLGWQIMPSDRSVFLHKLYVLPERHGLGIGAAALRWLENEARSQHANVIRLRVNRHNSRAIRAYLREGFVFESDVCSDIGGGFVMDDHVLAKHLTSA